MDALRGCVEVDAAERLARARRGPPARALPGAPASVNTLRWWSGSEWTSSRRRVERRARSRRSRRGRGPRRRSGPRAAWSRRCVEHVPPARRAPARPSTSSVASSTTTSRWIGTDTVPPIPALAPKATCTVPRIFSSSSTLPVSVRPVVGARPRARRGCVPRSPCARAAARGTRDPGRPRPPTSRPSSTVSVAGSSLSPSGARLDGDDRALAADRRDEPLAAGQVAERARSRSGRRRRRCPSRPLRSSVKSVPRGQVTCAVAACVQQRGHRLRARGHRVEVDRHHAREHVLGDAGHRRAARAGSVARLRAVVWLSDRLVGAMNTSQACQRRRDGRAAARCRRSPARPSAPARRRAAPPRPRRAAPRRSPACPGRHDHEHVLARLDGQAAADDGADGWSKVSHGRRIICLRRQWTSATSRSLTRRARAWTLAQARALGEPRRVALAIVRASRAGPARAGHARPRPLPTLTRSPAPE